MTATATSVKRPTGAANVVVSILLLIVGIIVGVLEAVLDVLLSLTSADSPGGVEGALGVAFFLLFLSCAVWLASAVVTIVFLVRRRIAWPFAFVASAVPLACAAGGFLAVTSVVQ